VKSKVPSVAGKSLSILRRNDSQHDFVVPGDLCKMNIALRKLHGKSVNSW